MKINSKLKKLNILNIKKVIEYLLYFLVFSLPLQTRYIISAWTKDGFSLEFSTISFYFTDLLIIILVLLTLSVYFKTISSQIKNRLWYFLGAFEIFIISSIIFSYNYKLSLFHYFWFVIFALLIWVLITVKYNKLNLLLWFLAGSLFQGFLGIFQFISQTSFSNKYLGMASHGAFNLGQAVIETASGRWLRAYGSLDHPNIFGALMAISLLVSLYLLLAQNKKIINYKKLRFSLYFWISSLVSFMALFLSFSRLAIGAGFIGTLIIVLYYLFYKKNYRQVIKVSLTLVLLSVILISIYSQLFFSRLDTSNRLEAKSINERQEQIVEAKTIIKDNLYFGVGVGNYSLVLKDYYPDKDIYELQPVHNSFLLLMAEIGIFGFMAFLVFFIYLFVIAYSRKQVLYISLWLVLLIIMLAEHWLISLHFGWLLMALISGLILKPINANDSIKKIRT
ncbi:MAG TPA: O-antigen ligase family protein [Patescibacteria group bacterium]|nr:O-antigen ligase family protein [Patescibacteria group bacterium]